MLLSPASVVDGVRSPSTAPTCGRRFACRHRRISEPYRWPYLAAELRRCTSSCAAGTQISWRLWTFWSPRSHAFRVSSSMVLEKTFRDNSAPRRSFPSCSICTSKASTMEAGRWTSSPPPYGNSSCAISRARSLGNISLHEHWRTSKYTTRTCVSSRRLWISFSRRVLSCRSSVARSLRSSP